MPGKAALVRARRNGRALIATNWAVDALVGFKPKGPGELKTHAEQVLEKIAVEGFKEADGDMPSCVFACRRRMATQAARLLAAKEGSAPASAPAVAPAPLADGRLEEGAGAAS